MVASHGYSGLQLFVLFLVSSSGTGPLLNSFKNVMYDLVVLNDFRFYTISKERQ